LQATVTGKESVGIYKNNKGRHVPECRARDAADVGEIHRIVFVQLMADEKAGEEPAVFTVNDILL
jgi:hypothetical protein